MISFKRLLITSLFLICAISTTTNAMKFPENVIEFCLKDLEFYPREEVSEKINVFYKKIKTLNFTDGSKHTNQIKWSIGELCGATQMFKQNCDLYEQKIATEEGHKALTKELSQKLIICEPKDVIDKAMDTIYTHDILNYSHQLIQIVPLIAQQLTHLANTALKLDEPLAQKLLQQAKQLIIHCKTISEYKDNFYKSLSNFKGYISQIKPDHQCMVGEKMTIFVDQIVTQEIRLAQLCCQPFVQICTNLFTCADQVKKLLAPGDFCKRLNLLVAQHQAEHDQLCKHLDHCLQLLKENFGIESFD